VHIGEFRSLNPGSATSPLSLRFVLKIRRPQWAAWDFREGHYKKLLKQREWRLRWAEKAGMGFEFPGLLVEEKFAEKSRNAQLAQLIEFRKVG
jgi:hypothetical protein